MLLATKTVLFNADGSGGEAKLRALDKTTGKRLWEMALPGAVGSPPMSYMVNGKQYRADVGEQPSGGDGGGTDGAGGQVTMRISELAS